jgi:DNA-directed RNA polymerase subunit beta'
MKNDYVEDIIYGLHPSEYILNMSKGEVIEDNDWEYYTHEPIMSGLYCEKIFGPVKDWTCHCGKYIGESYRGIICEECGVEITNYESSLHRIGHIKLASPVLHPCYKQKARFFLGLSKVEFDRLLNNRAYLMVDPGPTSIPINKVISSREHNELISEYGRKLYKVKTGAEAIYEMLNQININHLLQELNELSKGYNKEFLIQEEIRIRHEINIVNQNYDESLNYYDLKNSKFYDDQLNEIQFGLELFERLDVVNYFCRSMKNPTWMVLDNLPVIPRIYRANLKSMKIFTNDIDTLYRNVRNRNSRLLRDLEYRPTIIIEGEKNRLQNAVDALYINSQLSRPETRYCDRVKKPLLSLMDLFKIDEKYLTN